MKLSVRAITIAMGVLGAGSMLIVGIINLFAPGYGADFLRMMSSVYPGFHNARTWASVAIETLYGFADGAIFGLVFSWLYDWIVAGTRSVGHQA